MGGWLAAVSWNNRAYLWDGINVEVFEGITATTFSKDDQILALSSVDNEIFLWDTDHREINAVLRLSSLSECENCRIRGLAFDIDARHLAIVATGSQQEDTLFVIDATTGEILAIKVDDVSADVPIFTTDGRFVLVGHSTAPILWEWGTDTIIKFEDIYDPDTGDFDHQWGISTLVLDPTGTQVASAGYVNGTVQIWDVERQKQVMHTTGEFTIFGLAYSPDGQRIASINAYGRLQIWDIRNGELFEAANVQYGHGTTVGLVIFNSDDSRLFTGSLSHQGSDERFLTWDVQSGQLLTERINETGLCSSIVLNPDHSQVAYTYGDSIIVRDTATGILLFELGGHAEQVTCLDFSPNGRLIASGSVDNAVRLWEMGQHVATLEGHTADISSLAFSSNGTMVASGSADQTVRVWRLHNVEPIQPSHEFDQLDTVNLKPEIASRFSLNQNADWVYSAFDADGSHLIIFTEAGSGSIWDIQRNDLVATFPANHPKGNWISISSDNFAISAFRGIQVFDRFSGDLVFEVENHEEIIGLALDRTFLATSVAGSVELRNVTSSRIVATLDEQTGESITSIALSRDSKQVAAVYFDGQVIIWNLVGK